MGLGGRPLPAPPPNAVEQAHESNTEWILGVTGLFCSLGLLAIGLRVYVRASISKLVGWDDCTMMFAGMTDFDIRELQITSLATMICFGVQANYGMGKHYEARTQADDTNLQFVSFLQANIGLIPGLAVLKVSIGPSLLRLSRTRWYNYALYGLLAFVVFSEIFGSCTIIFFCSPVRQYWDGSTNGKCYPITLFVKFGVIHTGFNIASDVAFATLPIPII
ncbi:hypothetical protein EDB80DRAFT_877523 [Ilyonectria destructans]|nr:hypothetical protein EDB80DRAFT_877523 [Ilyonectria destructans]